MPLATINAVAPQRTTLETSVTTVNTALTIFETTYFSGATPPVPTPAELTRLITEGANILTEITALSTGHTHALIAALDARVVRFRDDIDNAQGLFVGHEAEWRTNIMTPAAEAERRSGEFISEASGSWIRRRTRNGLERTIVLNAHNRQETKKFLKRHKGTIASATGAGVVLWAALSMDGCSTSPAGQQPPVGNTSNANGKHLPVDKQGDTTEQGKNYDREGKKFSVGGFLNASKTVFPNGASPSAQAFQGVWNYIAENCKDEKMGFGEQYHFHTTPANEETDLSTKTHYDISAYTASHDAKVIEITWQMPNSTNGMQTKNGKKVEQRSDHTWKYTLNKNGTISFTDVYADGKIVPRGTVSKTEFQENLNNIQGF